MVVLRSKCFYGLRCKLGRLQAIVPQEYVETLPYRGRQGLPALEQARSFGLRAEMPGIPISDHNPHAFLG